MRLSRAFAGLFLLALTIMAGPVYAAEGALAGIYQLTATNEVEDTETLYLNVMLKDSQIVLFVLTPGGGPWYYGVAELNGQRLTGTIFESSGDEMGPFDLQLTPELAEGTLTTLFDSVAVTGPRVF